MQVNWRMASCHKISEKMIDIQGTNYILNQGHLEKAFFYPKNFLNLPPGGRLAALASVFVFLSLNLA